MTRYTIGVVSGSKSPCAASTHDAGDESHLLREIVRTNQVLVGGFSRLVGMTASRVAVLRLLAIAAPEGAGILKLARQLGINAAAVTRLVKVMEAERLVLRRADASDGRRTCITLSAKGMRTFERLHRHGHELERALASIISAREMAVTVKVLTSLRTYLENLD